MSRNRYVPSIISVPSNVSGPRYLMAYNPEHDLDTWTLERARALQLPRWYADDICDHLIAKKRETSLIVESEFSACRRLIL